MSCTLNISGRRTVGKTDRQPEIWSSFATQKKFPPCRNPEIPLGMNGRKEVEERVCTDFLTTTPPPPPSTLY